MKDNIFATRDADGVTTKKDPRVKFLGQCDLLSSYLSYVYHITTKDYVRTTIDDLSCIMSFVIGFDKMFQEGFFEEMLKNLTTKTDELNSRFSGLRPLGITKDGSIIHIARAICRQTELMFLDLLPDNIGEVSVMQNYIAQYLNKLSTYLYNLASEYEIA